MAVAFDAKVTSTTDTGAVQTISNTTLTVGSGSNRVLIACFGINSATAPTGVTAAWDPAGSNQALTQITNASHINASTVSLFLYGLINPVAGNKTLTISWTSAAAESHLAAVSFTGVDQTSVAVAFPNGVGNQGTSTSGSQSVTSATGNMICACYGQTVANFTSTSGTTISLDTTATGVFSIASLYDNGAASVATTAAWGGTSTTWGVVGTDILASVASGGGGFPTTIVIG